VPYNGTAPEQKTESAMPHKQSAYAAFYHFAVFGFADKTLFIRLLFFRCLYLQTICRRGSADFIDSLSGMNLFIPLYIQES